MLFHIRHVLHYRYAEPVFLEPTTVRLSPRQDASQRLHHHSLVVEASPSGRSPILDVNGGEAVVLWFDDRRQELRLELDMRVETLRSNPFDWIVTEVEARRLPMTYPPAEALALAPYRQGAEAISPMVTAWAETLAAEVGGDTGTLLIHLADTIHHDFHHVGRPEGEPMTAEQTLADRTGACRDTAMLYVEACRSLGLAARFVSGYSMHHPEEVTEHELHAWAEVYVPGGGWRGYDPSLGLAVADGHVALTSAPDHRLAAAVSGSYRGTGIESTLTYGVVVTAAPTGKDLDELLTKRKEDR